ncbi:hypothetical protein NLI96_g7487 [Meripilus lineatus]|uniref:Uncharacterized protein n=1 Tax=Meripilus lineatus TaxID=2056292 RepID=A0AAD5V198_9APHY|nr:hypothetical protein NLI96_g7487 [Physisporinus lineatus]
MDALTSSSSERRWYNTLELIPLVILQNLAYGFTTASVVKFLYLIECGTFSPSDPGGVPGSVCHEPSALAAIKQDAFLCVGVTTVSAIVVSGVYSHRLNGGERKKAMGVAASTQLLGSLWGLFLLFFQSFRNIPCVLLMVLSQGLGGGEIVLSAANIVLAVDASKTSWRSSSLAVILVAQTLPIWFATVTGFEPGKSLLIAQACWIIYLSYLALFIREAPHPTDTPITPSADRMESDSEAENLEPRVRSQTHQSLSKATVEPIKLFFREGNSSLVWIGVVTFVVPMAEHFCWRYGITSSVAYHLPFGYNIIFLFYSAIAKEGSLLFLLPISVVLYRHYNSRCADDDVSTPGEHVAPNPPTERTPLLAEAGLPPSQEAIVNPESSPSERPESLSASQDLFIARSSFFLIILGSFIMFLSKSWDVLFDGFLLFSLGAPFRPCIQSLASQVTDPSQLGRVITMLVAIESLGSVLLSPHYLPLVFQKYYEAVPPPANGIVIAYICTFVICGGIVSLLGPARFIRAHTLN